MNTLKPGLNTWADNSHMGGDLRNLYRGAREWYTPTTVDPRTKAVMAGAQQLYDLIPPWARPAEMERQFANNMKRMTEASLQEQRMLKHNIVMAGLLPPAIIGGAGIGATLAVPPLYDLAKNQALQSSETSV